MRIPHLRTGLFVLAAWLLPTRPASAQLIDLSLHATAVPDSFEIRATSTGAPFSSLPNGVFSIRWEVASGGVVTNSDLRRGCPAYSFLGNSGTTVDIDHYRYFTVVFFGDRTLEQANCPITASGMVLGTIRIRELSGCRNVALVENAFTGLNNLDYYISMGGYDVTGDITSAPITAGDCPPCEPPVITEIGADSVPNCGSGVHLWASATGTTPDYSWFDIDDELMGWLSEVEDAQGLPGTYTLIASNACGADTAQVDVVLDPELCVPPVIESAWYQPWGGGLQLFVAVEASCPGLSWLTPGGSTVAVNSQGIAQVSGMEEGVYLAIAVNACGADTVELEVADPQGCAGPTIFNASITSSGAPCNTGSAQFTATVSGLPGTVSTAWYNPQGNMLTGSAQFTVPYAPAGSYMFRAWNDCDADTVFVFHGPADTTGLANCTPPEILSVGPALSACLDDTVHVLANYSNEGPCATVRWWRGNTTLSTTDSAAVVLNSIAPIRFTATNACGQVTMEVPLTIWYADQIYHKLCLKESTPLSMDSMMQLEHPYQGGQWLLNGAPVDHIYDPAVDTSGFYYYHMEVDTGVVCPVVELILMEYPHADAGEDTTVTVCTTDPPFLLFDMLGGDPMPDGYWEFNFTIPPPLFDPATGLSGIYRYTKIVGQFFYQCTDGAYLTINVEEALPWYADTDGDGLGDALDSLLSCDPVEGHVANGEVACPQLFGTVGDPCDDGDPATNDEVITEDCACIGGMGIDDVGSTGGWQVWPNPARGVVQLQGPSGTDALHITVVDASGREVLRTNFTSKPITLHTEGLAPGTYSVHIRTTERTSVLRLVVR